MNSDQITWIVSLALVVAFCLGVTYGCTYYETAELEACLKDPKCSVGHPVNIQRSERCIGDVCIIDKQNM